MDNVQRRKSTTISWDLTVLVRERGGQYLEAAPAKSFTFTSEVQVWKSNNSIMASSSILEYSKNNGEWIPLISEQTVPFQTGDSVRVREAAQYPFPAGEATTYNFE